MKEHDLHTLLDDSDLLHRKIQEFQESKVLVTKKYDKEEIDGHLLKAQNNLRFVEENTKLRFYDWAITGCYYACYHAALSLILTKGYSSKSHLATLCILIREFYKNGLSKEDIEVLSSFLDYQDLLFYVESKNEREKATYSTRIAFTEQEVTQLKLKAAMFVGRIRQILEYKTF